MFVAKYREIHLFDGSYTQSLIFTHIPYNLHGADFPKMKQTQRQVNQLVP
jgi:hypothetical protein